MKKRIISFCMALTLIFASLPQTVWATEKIDEVAVYTQYLLDGGYTEMIGHEVEPEYLDISTCLIDIDTDGVYELLISLMDTEFSGPHGYPTFSALLDIQNEKVVTALSACHWGGTMGGDYLVIKYDNIRQSYVIALDGYLRDGVYAGSSYLQIYSCDDWEIEYDIASHHYDLSVYEDQAAEVRQQTDLYIEDGEDFRYFTVNNEYVTEEDYNKISERFAVPDDSVHQFYSGTYDTPINSNSYDGNLGKDEDIIKIEAYTAFPDSTIGTQQEVKIQFSKYVNDSLATIEDYTLDISNLSVIESTEEMESNGSKIITIKGLKQGTSDLTFIENSTGTSITLPLIVADKCNYFRCSAFPIPYESSGSIYVADYTCSANEDGSHSISFNAYNTSYAYGVVEVYNENGTLIKLVPLDPRTDSSGMEKVVNGFKWVWEDIKDLFDGDTPFYTKEKNAKHTPVTLDNIPENAEIIITSDGDESNFATLYMGVDTFVRTVCTASSIDLKLDAQAATVKELMNALVDSLIKSISHDETDKMIKQGLIKEASKSISTALSFSSSADSVSDICETVSNMFQSMDINTKDIMLNVLKGMGYNIADAAFTTVVPLYKIVNFVDQILETAWPLTDYQFNIGRGKMEIHVAKHGLQNFVSNNSVTITKRSNFNANTVLDAYVVAETDELGNLTDVITEGITNYDIYNITLRENGAEIQPDDEIEIRLPVPDGADGKKCVVYRIEEDGEKTLLSSSYKDGYVTFRTPHLSYYLIGEVTNSSAPTGIIIISILLIGGIAVTVVFLKHKKYSR